MNVTGQQLHKGDVSELEALVCKRLSTWADLLGLVSFIASVIALWHLSIDTDPRRFSLHVC